MKNSANASGKKEATASVEEIIRKMIKDMGVSGEARLCKALSIDASTLSQCRKRGNLPQKYPDAVSRIVKQREEGAEVISTIQVTTEEFADVMDLTINGVYQFRTRNPRLYETIANGIRLEKAMR